MLKILSSINKNLKYLQYIFRGFVIIVELCDLFCFCPFRIFLQWQIGCILQLHVNVSKNWFPIMTSKFLWVNIMECLLTSKQKPIMNGKV